MILAFIVSILCIIISESYNKLYIKNYGNYNKGIIISLQNKSIYSHRRNNMIETYSKNNVDDNSNDDDEVSNIDIDNITSNNSKIILFNKITKQLVLLLSSIILSSITNISMISIPSSIVHAKESTSTTVPSLEKCFNAIEKELSDNGDSLRRINKDISTEDWNDLKLFTREYDAGFRGGVLKVAWKQLKGIDGG